MAAEVLGALSHALDLVEGQTPGHAERTWLIARRVGVAYGLGSQDLTSLYFACVLKDSGCSTNSSRIQRVFGGDEHVAKKKVKFVNWSNSLASAWYAIGAVNPAESFTEKLRRLLKMAGKPGDFMDEVTADRCNRGADIALELGFGTACAEAIRTLDEHWDGHGSPAHLQGDQIPVLGRIVCLAQTMEVFASTYGPEAAYQIARKRNRKWFDPALVRAACSFERDQSFWDAHQLHAQSEGGKVGMPPGAWEEIIAGVDRICQAFSTVVDAKSTFTAAHSHRVASYAVAIGTRLGLSLQEQVDLHRAGMLHDIGKLSVPNAILDKPGKLDEVEYARIKGHPKHSWEILRRIPTFERLAALASTHHERLDGRGYWQGLSGDQLDLGMRCLTAADVFDALTAERPYRGPMSREEALAIMRKDAGTAFDPRCLEALETVEPDRHYVPLIVESGSAAQQHVS